MDEFLKMVSAVNDETRVKILRFICTHKELCVCDIESSFDMIQSRVSRHLKILKDAGFLDVRRDGRWGYYTLSKDRNSFSDTILEEINSLDIPLPKLNKGCKNV